MDNFMLGKYKLEKHLGRGAMGVIYEAFDTTLHRKVAVKTMTSELISDQNLKKRFYLEARAAGNLRHPNIITIYDMGEDNDTPYIVMELLEGTDLKSLIQSDRHWPWERIVHVVAQVAVGLNYAHQNGIVHRDIKPANIFVMKDDVVKILDFGVAHVLSSTMTQAGMLLGSLGYMAPEQISGVRVDGRADQYSVGVIMYELVTGSKPFMEKDIPSTIHAIMKTPPTPLRKIRDDCLPEMEKIVLKCLEKERDNRFGNLGILAKALDQFIESQTAAHTRTGAVQGEPNKAQEPAPPPGASDKGVDTRKWLSMQDLLNQSRAQFQGGDVTGAFSVLREHYKLYQKDPEFQTFFRQIRTEKEVFDKKALLQKHYHDALKLLEEDNFKLARLELETMVRIEPSSITISQLEQMISQREACLVLNEWLDEGEKLVAGDRWKELNRHMDEGDSKFGRIPEFGMKKEVLIGRIVDGLVNLVKKSAKSGAWEQTIEAAKPFALRFPGNRTIQERLQFAEQQLAKAQGYKQIHDWMATGQKLVAESRWEEFDVFLTEGDKKFGDIRDYHTCRKALVHQREKAEVDALLDRVDPLEGGARLDEAVALLRPILRRFPENRALVERYNRIMQNKTEVEKEESVRRFIQDQSRIVSALIKSKQFGQAKKYTMVLLDKYPGTAGFEEQLIEIENHLDFERSVTEIRQCVETEDVEKGAELFVTLKEAYPDEVQTEILQHELENLRITLANRNSLADSEARLASAVRLAENGAYDKALEIVRTLMRENPEHTFLYTNYLTIKSERETREKEDLMKGLVDVDDLEKSGEVFFAWDRARALSECFPSEETLPRLRDALKRKFMNIQVEKIQRAMSIGALGEAGAAIDANLKLIPDERTFLELRDGVDMEQQKRDFTQAELRGARQAVEENRVDDALETVNSLISLSPHDQGLKDFLKDLIYRKTRAL